jgi:hypothetical protein
VAREIAERLRRDRVKVWLDESELKPATTFGTRFKEGLERSRVPAPCLSANAFGSEWGSWSPVPSAFVTRS